MNTHSYNQKGHPSSVGKRPDRPASTFLRGRARHEEPSADTAGGFSAILRGYPISLAVTVLSGAIFITAAAFAAYHSPDPTALIPALSAVALALAALSGGMTAGKLNPTCPLAASLFCGGVTAVLMILPALALGSAGGLIPWLMRIGMIPLHLLGGIVARPRRKGPAHTAKGHSARR